MKRSSWTFAVLGALTFAGRMAHASEICTNLDMVWHDPVSGAVLRSDPYVCGADLCAGYRCKDGNEISPACYNAAECPVACAGECVHIATAQLDCATLCDTGGGTSSPSCDIVMTWYKRRTLVRSEPYDCTVDACTGYRCLDDGEISPACYDAAQCAKVCKGGICVDIGASREGDCNAALCGDS